MIEIIKKRRLSSILGLTLEAGRIEGAVVRRTNGSFEVPKAFQSSLALNPLTGEPELVGREIRNHLEREGIRERRCIVGLPLSWAMVLPCAVPELPEADIEAFLQIEAERGFPYGPEALCISSTRCRLADGGAYATMAAVAREQVDRLLAALKAAQLKPLSFTLSAGGLQTAKADPDAAAMALVVGEVGVDLMMTYGDGIVALRALDGTLESDGVQKRFYPDLLAREIRITLGQLPDNVSAGLRQVRLYGAGEAVDRLVLDLAPRLERLGLELTRVVAWSDAHPGYAFPTGTPVLPPYGLAARYLGGRTPVYEFLPPKVSPWQQIAERFSSRKLVWVGSAVGAGVVLASAAFVIQGRDLAHLEDRWKVMGPKVKQLEAVQEKIRQFRPWFDEHLDGLQILRKVTEAFPENGSVYAKSLELRDLSLIICTGIARDKQSFFQMSNRLKADPQIRTFNVDRLRGEAPVQFSFSFRWGPGEANEN